MKVVITIKEVEAMSNSCDNDCDVCSKATLCRIICNINRNIPPPNSWNRALCKSVVNNIKESVKC